jgi:hypothetical protein
MTVAYRHQDGTWTDLTGFFVPESGGTSIGVGELGRSLTNAGTEPVGPRPIPDSTIPGTVSWVTPFTTGVYLDALGNTKARILVSWILPLNADGSTILDGSHYEIRYGVTPATTWQTEFAPWGTLQQQILDLAPGVSYDFQIRAVDLSGNQGAWSATETAVANPDTIAPSTPAPPTVAGSRLAIQITHQLGKASGGTFNLELDLDHFEVHVGSSSGFTPDSTTLKGKVLANSGMIRALIPAVGTVDVEETTTRYVKVIAVDEAGNKSSASTAATATALLIDDAHISDLTVTKVTAGTISANWLIGASIRTASAGQRVELNQTGLHGFNSGGTELVTLSNTGSFTLRSASSGARIELDNSGFRAFNGSAQQTVDIASATGNVTIVGQLSSAFSGRRIVFNPSGTTDPEIRFLPNSGVVADGARMYLQNSGAGQAFLKFEGPQDGVMRSRMELGSGNVATSIGQKHTSDLGEDMIIYMGTSYVDRRMSFAGRIKETAAAGNVWGETAICPGSVDVDGSVFSVDYEGLWFEPYYAMFTPTAGNPVGHAVTQNDFGYFNGQVSIALSGSDRVTFWSIRL